MHPDIHNMLDIVAVRALTSTETLVVGDFFFEMLICAHARTISINGANL